MRGKKRHQKNQLSHCVEEELHRGSGRSQLLFKRGQSIYHKEQSLSSREGMDKNHLKENLPALRVL